MSEPMMEKSVRRKALQLGLRLQEVTPEDISNYGLQLRLADYSQGALALLQAYQALRGDELWLACIDPHNAVWAGLLAARLEPQQSIILATARHHQYEADCINLLLAQASARSVAAGLGLPNFHSALGEALIQSEAPRIGASLESYVQSIGESGSFRLPPPGSLPRPRIRIRFRLRYENGLADIRVERRPRLHFFLSRNLCRRLQVLEVPSEAPLMELGEVRFEQDCMLPYVPRDARLNIHVYSNIKNKDKEWCGNQAGLCSVALSQLWRQQQPLTLELLIPTDNNSSKGRLCLSEIHVDCLQGLSPEDPRPLPPPEESPEACSAAIQTYIRSCYEGVKRMSPSWPAIKNIHAYVYQSQAGQLPAALFDVTQVTPSPEAFYLNLLDIVLAREGRERAWFREDASELQVAHCSTEMVTVYVNWCRYITDKVFDSSRQRGRRPDPNVFRLTESFDCVRCRGRLADPTAMQPDPVDAADCEDFARESLAELHEIRIGRWHSPELQRIQKNCKLFIDGVCLGGVSSMKLDGHFENVKNMGAHEYLIRLPCHVFFRWLTASEPEHPLLRLASLKWQAAGQGMEFLIAEGTGLLYPSATSMDPKRTRDWLEGGHEGAFECLRKRYTFQKGGESSFYKECSTFFTNNFLLKGFPFVKFMYMLHQQHGSSPTYGVPFQEVTLLSSKISMLPQPKLSMLVRLACKCVLKDCYPIQPFFQPSRKALKEHAAHEIVQELQSLGDRSSSSSFALSSDSLDLVYFLRRGDAHLRTIQALKLCLRSKPGVSVSVKPELVTAHGIGGFYLVFHVPRR